MSAAELVRELEALGVRLWEDSGLLRFRAPQGVLTPERREELKRHKAAVLEHLRESAAAVLATPNQKARYEPFPLTDLQSAYVIGRSGSIAYGGVACHAYGELLFPDLDPPQLERAWRRVVARHDMLRAVVDGDGWQRVLEEPPEYRIAVADLRDADPEVVRGILEAVRTELDHQVHPLGVWPMFDLRVTRASERAVLHLSIDFLIADYVSLRLVLDELRRLYADPEGSLPQLGITFRDYLEAERRLRTESGYARDRHYWWARLDDLPPAPELPVIDRPSGDAKVRFRRLETRLAGEDAAAFGRRARRHGVSLSAAVLGAYAEVVAAWSRHPRFSLNVTVLQRLQLHADVDRLVGDFTSVNLLAVDAAPSAPFHERMRAAQEGLWEDLDHRLCSGVEVMRELTRRRGPGAALMPVVYTSALGAEPREGATGVAMPAGEFTYGISQTPQVWIDCQAMPSGGDVAVNWDVREGVLPHGVVDDMFGAFATLLARLARGDEPWTAPSPLALPARQQERRGAVNCTAGPLPNRLLHEPFLDRAASAPERVALIGAGGSLTYGELLARAGGVAERLIRDGCRPGDLVGVWMQHGPGQVVAVLGVLLAGGAYVPIDVDQPPLRRARMLADAGVRLLLTETRLAAPQAASPLVRIDVDALEPAAGLPPVAGRPPTPDDLAYVIYTSGSTGAPKGVMISHRSALNTVQDINDRFGVGAGDRLIGLTSLDFDLSVYDIFGALGAGACLVMAHPDRRTDPSHWAELVAEHGGTIWNSVPAQMQMLHDYLERDPVALPSLRLALLSGDWIPVALPDQIRGRLPSLRVVSLGGATEGSIWSIFHPIERVDPAWRSIPYGTPLSNQTIHVCDATLRPRPEWVTGELYIGGAGVALGYLGDSEKTAERFLTHPATGERLYRTGDLGRFLPGGIVELLGREDSQIKIRGHRIELAEVETALRTHPRVAGAAVVVYGDRPTERRLAGFVEPARRPQPGGGEDAAWLSEAVARRVSRPAAEDCAEVVRFSRQLDDTALAAMLGALAASGSFVTTGTDHSLEDVLDAARVEVKHQRLVRRWLKALARHGLIERERGTGRYRALVEIDCEAVEEAWRRLDALQPSFDRRTELIEYFRLAGDHLPELLRGELDPLELLFPEGRVDIHEVAYNDNFLSRYLNGLVVAAVAEIAAAHELHGPFRVLEPGAGVGGTSIELIPSLAAIDATYLFSDVSPFFLNNARERFAEFPWVTYALYDINRDYRPQGLMPNSFDAIVCANVLHYARDAGAVLDRFRELLRPDGWLVFIDMVRDNYQVLTSMEFLFDATAGDFEDVRAGRDETFIALDQWHQLLAAAGGEVGLCLPAPGDLLAEIGFHVVAARFKHDRAPLHVSDLGEHLAARLPEYMIPRHLQIVDDLPVTGNVKIDRGTLRSWVPAAGAGAATAEVDEPAGDLERRVAATWAAVLGVERVGGEQSFYELGGDSLLAAQLVGRMREEIPEAGGTFFDALLRSMLDGPTVRELAAHLREASEGTGAAAAAAAAASSPLVHLKTEGEGPLRVLVHDASGTLASYAALLDELGERGRLAGLVVHDANYLATQPAVLVGHVAATYARTLREAGADPIHLIGYDVGGILAVEVARQLLEESSVAVDLTVINSLPVPYVVDDELFTEYLFVRLSGVDPVRLGYPAEAAVARAIEVVRGDGGGRIGEGLLAALGGDPQLDGVAWSFRRLAARPVEDRLAAIARAVNRAASPAAPPGQVRNLYEVFRHSLRAFALHDVAPYAGDLTVMRSREPTPLEPSLGEEVERFWGQVCLGAVRTVQLPGSALDCLRPPSSDHLLEALADGETVAAADG